MARTNIPIQSIPNYGESLDDISWTAADDTNDHSFVNNGNTLLLYKNGDSGSHTADVIAPAGIKTYNEAVAKTMTCGAGDICIAGPFDKSTFNQSDGTVNVDLTDDTSSYFACVQFQNPN